MDPISSIQEIIAELEPVAIEVHWRPSGQGYGESERDSNDPGPTGFDVAQFKKWEPGKRLDSRATARTGWRTLLTRVYDEPRPITVFALTEDSDEDSPTIDFGMVNQTKKQLAAMLKASVLSNAACTNELAGYAIWSGRKLRRFRSAEPADEQLLPALSAYLDPQAECDEDDPQEQSGLAQALMRLPFDRRCLVFVITDCLSLTAADMEALEEAAIHDIVFLVVSDLRERELPEARRSHVLGAALGISAVALAAWSGAWAWIGGWGWASAVTLAVAGTLAAASALVWALSDSGGFRDIEDLRTGQTVTIWLSDKTRAQWREEFDQRRQQLRQRLADLGIAMEEFYTHEQPGEIMDRLLPIYAGDRP